MSNFNLPSIHHIRADIAECPNRLNGCHQAFGEQQTLQAHVQICPYTSRVAQRHDSWFSLQRDSNTSLPLQLNTQLHSPPSSVSDSDSEGVYTPNVSRAPSLCISQPASRRSSLARTQHRRRPSTPMTADHDANKKVKKTVKEQQNRAQQKAVLCRQEDVLLCLLDWAKQEQSAGNGASAGISINKNHLQRVWERVGLLYLDRDYREAAAAGRLADFKQSMRNLLDEYSQEESDPYEGTLMELPPGELPCEQHDTKSKECKTHNHPDWIVCRRTRAQAVVEGNEALMLRDMGITKDQALHGAAQQGFGRQ